MSEVAADTFPSPSAQLSPDASLNGLPDEENMPGTQREDRRVQGIAGLAATCCACLEAERLKGCLNSEKICIAPILACLLSLCLCIAGLKWVFVDKIFEYDSPTHLDPGRIGQDPKSAVDPTALSAWVPSEVYASPFLVPSPKSKAEVTVHSDSSLVPSKPFLQPSLYNRILDVGLLSSVAPSLSPPALEPTTASQAQATETNLQTAPKLSTSTSTTGTSHLTKCDIKQKAFCVNGGECYMVKDLPNPPRYLCRCPNEFTGDRCQNYVMASFYKAEELYQKRVLTITGICIALLVVGIMCVVAYCKTKKQRKKLHDRLRQSLRSERNNVMNMANGPHHPNPPPDNVQLVNQYVSKNVISSEHVIERETETSFSTSHYTSTTHHSVTVTQTPSHSWSNGHTESILSESHSVLVSSSMENSRHASPAGPRGRLNGIGGPREGSGFPRHARETPDSYRDSPHSERYVSAMTTPARMSPVDFHTPTSPKSRPSTMSPPASSLTVSIPSVAVSPFIEEERPLLLVTPLQLHEKYDHHLQQFNSFHHNATHESNSLPPSPLRIVEDEEYETTQEYEPAQEPPKKLTNSRRVKRTKPNGHISSRVELDSDTSSESSSSETETEDERIGEDTPFLSIPNPGAAGLEPATAFRLAETRTNPANRFSTPEELQARLSSVIANQDPIAV
ncbi:pro-neuregulin-1, membrane-bound isoform isoform X5 [Lonchura striata]|uniref:pro-neuregulin-1, membrane-bound isoform isoform X4 n=1 Tax=Lonchura striata TaxID=40157 RepID=UPI000B4CFA7D|nr:pro-neuregulin-1, membrane-bound isoform isoform X4 [Lonchura striata domestica]XP_021390488.1 pro-neuregulin-1, membrane-bound isoform isoform X4 [Lonchura striata domestica]